MTRITNVALRLATLVTKLGLTFYMGRYLHLVDIGIYGLAFGAVMTAGCFLGIRLDYLVARELVDVTPLAALTKMRDQAAFYGINYVIAGILLSIFFVFAKPDLDTRIIIYIFAIMVTDSFANLTYINMNSMKHQLLANMVFFIRAGLWVLPVVFLGIANPAFRTVDAILVWWLGGIVTSLIITFWVWRHLPWSAVSAIPIDWDWIRTGVKKCVLIWLGTLGLAGGVYVDRFVVNHFLGIEKVGIATFYFSFANALFTLVQSGVLSFAYPKMIALHREQDYQEFWREVRQAFWHVSLFAGFIAVAVGVSVPLLGDIFHRPEFAAESLTLWLMLVAVFIRSNAETLYYVLFARHQDRAIWLGNLLFLIPAFTCNAVLVYFTGLSGIGYGSLIAMTALFAWRWWHIHQYDEERTAA